MKTYGVKIITDKEFEDLTGEKATFSNGFLINKCDWWNIFENHLNCPIISIRPSGRESWKELLVITADGYLDGDKRVISGDLNYCKAVMSDIFFESDTDEYEVFENYEFLTLSDNEKNEINKWLHENY